MVRAEAKMSSIVNRFLSQGKCSGVDLQELADACDRKVRQETQVSARKSVALGRKFVVVAKKHGGKIYLTALRACGWAELVAGNYKQAEAAYLAARSLVSRDPQARSLIDRVLIDVYMYLDDFKQAGRRATRALKTFKRLGADEDVAKTEVNYGNLLHRQDRHSEANKLYRRAGDYFNAQGNDFATALCWYNQGNTEVQLFDFETANKLFTQAREIFIRLDQKLYSVGCLYGLAWLHMLQGDFHIALQELTECEKFYQGGRHPREFVLCQLDRAECYLGLNLLVDSRKASDQARIGAKRIGLTYELAKANFFSGKASLGLKQVSSARSVLKRAAEGFRKVNNKAFLAATTMALAQLDHTATGRLASVRMAQRSLEKAQLPLWEGICDLQILTDWPEELSALDRLARNPAVKTVPHLAARRYTLLGDNQARQQKIEAAISHWTTAAEILDAVRAKLPPVDMRSSFFKTQSQPHQQLVAAVHEQEPLVAAVWSERFKTVGKWSTPVDQFDNNSARTKVVESLTELAGQVSAISNALKGTGGYRQLATRWPSVHQRLHRKVRQEMATLEKSTATPDSMEAVREMILSASQTQPIVQFHAGSKDLIAFVHHRGNSKTHCFVDGIDVVRDFIAKWRFLVETAPNGTGRAVSVSADDENRLLKRIGSWLLPPLELPGNVKKLLIVPEGQLSSLPWQALVSDGRALAEKYQLIFSPSVRHHLYASRRTGRSSKAKIFVGDAQTLPHVAQEIAAVRNRLGEGNVELFQPCRRADWPSKSNDNIWHFAGHAHLRADNPFYSSLMLADGPLFAADFRLTRNRVNLVTLAACRTGQQTSLPGEESTGLVRSLLEMGARNVVASGWAVSDESTSLWMDTFYREYVNRTSAGTAVQRAALSLKERFPSAYHWGAFSVFGTG